MLFISSERRCMYSTTGYIVNVENAVVRETSREYFWLLWVLVTLIAHYYVLSNSKFVAGRTTRVAKTWKLIKVLPHVCIRLTALRLRRTFSRQQTLSSRVLALGSVLFTASVTAASKQPWPEPPPACHTPVTTAHRDSVGTNCIDRSTASALEATLKWDCIRYTNVSFTNVREFTDTLEWLQRGRPREQRAV